jgi:hypothetical protein
MTIKVKNPFSLFSRSIKLRFDIYAWVKMCEVSGVDLDGLEKLNEQQLILAWMYGAYLSACASEYRRPAYGAPYISRVYKWYYVNDNGTLDEIKAAMIKSRILGREVQDWAKEGEKKN